MANVGTERELEGHFLETFERGKENEIRESSLVRRRAHRGWKLEGDGVKRERKR